MKRVADDRAQAMQRVRVGMIGLLAVVLLIGLASALLSGMRDDRAAQAAGGSNAAVVANMAQVDEAMFNEADEPLVDLGVAPGSASVDAIGNGQAR